jgi:hypothetical protein
VKTSANPVCVAVALAALSSGCIVDIDDDEPWPATGNIAVSWTIDGVKDPYACAYYALDPDVGMDLELRIFDRAGYAVATEYAPCEAWWISVPLLSGPYDAEATMVVPVTAEALSTTLPIERVQIYAYADTIIDIDFPESSFLYP